MNQSHESDRQRLYFVLGLGVSVVFLGLAAYRVDWSEVGQALGRTRFFPWIPLAILAYCAAMIVRGWRLCLLVQHVTDLPLTTASNIVAIGYGVNNILPGRLGELARAYVLMERSSVRFVQALTITLLERALDGVVMFLLLSMTTYSFASTLMSSHVLSATLLIITGAILGILMGLMAFAVVSPHSFARMVAEAVGLINRRWYERGLKLGIQIAEAFTYLRNPTGSAKVFALSFLTWLVEGLMFLFVFGAFGLPLNPWWALGVMAITNVGVIVPSSPGHIGPWHFFCSQALVLFGVSSSIAFSYAIVAHLTFYVPITLWSMWVLAALGMRWHSIASLRRMANPVDAAAPGIEEFTNIMSLPQRPVREEIERATPFYVALADAIMPMEDVQLSAREQEAVRSKVVEFLKGELDCLSHRLFVMFTIGMLVFRFATRLRFFQSFCDLSHERKAAWVRQWSDGPISLTRKLFRPVRSLVFLCYFECPEVQAAIDGAGGVSRAPVAKSI
jgi:uncharacterized protein (TIRG00374 family)